MRSGRLPWLPPDELTEDQRRLYDAITAGPRATRRHTPLTDDEGRLNGPFNALLTNPPVGDAIQALGSGLRFSGTLPRHLFELLVLLVAVERQAAYEWYAHAPIARAAGLTTTQLEAVRLGQDPELADDDERAVLALARASLAHRDPGDTLVRRVEDAFGRAGVTEIVAAVGFYDLLATVMRTWDAPLPPGARDPLQEPVASED